MSETQETAVLDRFEETEDGEEVAVLLIESDGEVVDEAVVSRASLPEEGRHQDAVYSIRLVGGDPVEFIYEPEETEDRKESASDRFDRLSKRLSDEDQSESPE